MAADALHVTGATDAREARLDTGGLIATQGATSIDTRTGVLFGPGSTAVVTGTSATAPMSYAVAVHHAVTTRGAAYGPYLGPTNDTATTATTTAAPASGSRIDIIYTKQQDNTAGIPTPDTGSPAPLIAVVQGTSSTGTPVAPPLPVGAEELARATVAAGATSTNGTGVTITNTARQTVARGARIPVRTQADRDALTLYKGLEVYRLDTGAVEINTTGTSSGWASTTPGTIGCTWTASPALMPSGQPWGPGTPTIVSQSGGTFTPGGDAIIVPVSGMWLVSWKFHLTSATYGPRAFMDINAPTEGARAGLGGPGETDGSVTALLPVAAGGALIHTIFLTLSTAPTSAAWTASGRMVRVGNLL